jgi:hypothetical protein
MKKTVRIKESQLNNIIKKVIKEQEQEMSTGPDPSQMAGAPEDETPAEGSPNFEEFINCAKTLLDQGTTIGELVDELVNSQNIEPESESEPNPDEEGGIEPEAPMNESKKRR